MSGATGPDLERVVRQLVGGDRVEVAERHREAVDYDAFLAGRAVARIRGTAVRDGVSVPWSFVEKRTDGPATASAYLYANGRREFAAYRSGLLDDLAPRVGAPRLLTAEESGDGRLTLWIEDLGPDMRNPGTADAVLAAARHLGRLAGRWLGRVPAADWLFRGWIDRHRQPHAMAEGLAVVEGGMADREIAARVGGRLDEAAELIAGQETVASILATLPETLCHHDAVAANVFAPAADPTERTVLIDWESIGPGPVGADLASLLFASPRRGDFSARLLPDLVEPAIAAYVAGIADVGAGVETAAVLIGFHASIALRWKLVADVVGLIRDPGRARRGSAPHETPETALDELIALVPVLLDSAAEARRLRAA